MPQNTELQAILDRTNLPDDPSKVRRYMPQHYLMMETLHGEYVRFSDYQALAEAFRAQANRQHQAEAADQPPILERRKSDRRKSA